MSAARAGGARRERRRRSTATAPSTLICIILGVLLLTALSSAITTAAAASYDTSSYVNSDLAINYLLNGPKLILVAQIPSLTFSANDFGKKLFNLFSAASPTVRGSSCVTIVNWCGRKSNILNDTVSCNSSEVSLQINTNLPYVYTQVQLCAWDSALGSPALVDLRSAGVVANMSVASFPGVRDPDKKSGIFGNNSYVTKISSDAVVVYAVFGSLLGAALLAIIAISACICLCDSRQANRNKSIVDRAIAAVRLDHLAALSTGHHSQQQPPAATNFSEHYNLTVDTVNNGTADTSRASQYALNSPQASGYTTREGVASREMQDMGAARGREGDYAKGKELW
ncbi:hypothetical protein NESM_000357700 [Novymonas esmeraldas]|uniref:Uncharacterized protein n=1 Tax=Novymonas esmeraldas TaxID=1808958 RepID=A0AAW0EMK2_9TRYP